MLFSRRKTSVAFLAASLLLASTASFAAEHPLFIVQDRDPSYEDAQVSLITDASNRIDAIRIVSGKKEFMRESLVNFQKGQSLKHLFVRVNNVAFDRTTGGKIQILFGRQNVDLDIVRQGPHWIAKSKGKRLKRVKVPTKRIFGMPVGVRDDIPLEIAQAQVEMLIASLSADAAAKTADPAGVNTNPGIYERIALKADAPGRVGSAIGSGVTQPSGEINIAL